MMTTKNRKAGHKKAGLPTIRESSESHPTKNSSSSISSSRPPSSLSTSHSSSNIRPASQAPSHLTSSARQPSLSSSLTLRLSSQAPSHPISSARTSSSSSSSTPQPPPSPTRSCAAYCTSDCCSGASSGAIQPSSSSRSRGSRPVSPNFLLPSIPPPTRRPRTMGKNKPSSSSRQKAKTASDSKAKLGDPATDNRNLERNIVQNAADWLPQAFPKALRPFFHGPALEVMRCVYKDKVQLYLMMKKFINEAKDGASRVHMIIFKPVPLNVIQNDMVWDYNIAPHCRFTYLEDQQTLFLNIATETRMIEHFPKSELNFDDTDMGVQGHALGRFKYGLKKQLSAMGIVDNRWEFACAKSRHGLGLIHDKKDNVPYKAIHTADRMFIPGIIRHPKYDANNQPWPTMVIECCNSCTNLASRLYLECSVDWWFSQSEGFTKVVMLMMFDYDRRGTVVEKWICAPKAPYTKRLAQTILIDVTRGENGKPTVTIDGEDLVLDFESLMARPKREGESDIVFDKALMNGFGNGHLMTWPNLGKGRKQNLKRSGIDLTTARKLLDYPLSTLQQHLGPALEKVEKAAKAVGADADVQASRMTLTLTRNKVDKGKGKEKEGELASGEDRIPVDITIGEALAIMAEKEGVEEEK